MNSHDSIDPARLFGLLGNIPAAVISWVVFLVFCFQTTAVIGQESNIEQRRQKALALWVNDKPAEAIPILKVAIKDAESANLTTTELYGQLLADLGACYRKANQPAMALEAYVNAQRAMKNAGTKNESIALVQVGLAQLLVAKGKFVEAKKSVEASFQILKEIGKPENDISARALHDLMAQIQFRLGNIDGTLESLSKSASIVKSVFGPKSEEYRSALMSRIIVLKDERPQEALGLAEQFLTNLAQTGVKPTRLAATCHSILHETYSQLGKHDQALVHAKEFVNILDKLSNVEKSEFAKGYYLLGVSFFQKGNMADARRYFARAIEHERQADSKDKYGLALILKNYASVCGRLYDFEAALPAVQESVDILGKHSGKNTSQYGQALLQYSSLLSDANGPNDEIKSNFEKAISILEENLGKQHPETASAYHAFGSHLWKARDMELSREYLSTAVEIATTNPEIGEGIANAYRNSLGAALEISGDSREALGNYQLAFDRVKDEDPSSSAYTSVLHNLSVSKLMNGEVDVAIRQQRKVRRGIHQYVQKLLPGLPEKDQLQYLGQLYKLRLHVALSFALHKDVKGSQTKEARKIAIDTAEWLINGKGLTAEALAGRQQKLLASDTPTAKSLRELLRKKAAFALAEKSDSQESKEIDDRERKLTLELGDILSPEVKPWTDIPTIRKRLEPSQVLIEFARFNTYNFEFELGEERYFPARYAAWVIPADGKGAVKAIDLGTALEIDSAIGRIAAAYSDPERILEKINSRGEKAATRSWRFDAVSIRRLVWDKIAPHLPLDTEGLVIGPDSSLWKLPWAALPIGGNQFLGEEYSVRFVISGRDIVRASDDAANLNSPAIFADPDFDLSTTETEKSVRAVLRKQVHTPSQANLRSGAKVPNVQRLPFTKIEAESVSPALKALSGKSPQTYTGKWALESVLKAVARPRYLMVSSHGFFLPEPISDGQANPLLQCGLLLAGCNTKQYVLGEDGVLTGLEVVNLDLRGTEMVILSACNTDTGKVNNGEGVAGLRQAFQLAGAESVLASLWQVDDAETARLMNLFFDNLANGMKKPEALRQAQLSRIKARRARHGAAHPFFWAAFTLTGQD